MMSAEFEEQEARIYAGLSVLDYEQLPGCMEWRTNEQPISKAEIIAFWRIQKRLAAIRDYEQNKPRKNRR